MLVSRAFADVIRQQFLCIPLHSYAYHHFQLLNFMTHFAGFLNKEKNSSPIFQSLMISSH